MAAEKLTIVTPLSVRLTETQHKDIHDLAALHGMERGEYIRHLVLQDKKEQHRIWVERNSLFAGVSFDATTTASDIVELGE